MPKATKNNNTIWISGRRKTSIARVKIEKGKGEFVVNDSPTLAEYFTSELDQRAVLRPFKVTGRDPKGLSVSVKTAGGGKKSQMDAIALALAKALEQTDKNLRPLLKKAGLLRRDPRMKERKKYGLKRARKAPQFSKR